MKKDKTKWIVKTIYGIFLFISGSFLVFCSTRYGDIKPEGPPFHLVVLHTNDHHGHPFKFFDPPIPDVGGLPARATLVKEIRKEERNVLLLDAGDINTGLVESNFFKAKPDIEGYNYIGYAAMTLGNHEFDNPLRVLKWQMEIARFPFLSANVRTIDGRYLATPYIIKEFPGFRVAIFGLTTRETQITSNPENIKDLIFEDEIEVSKRLVPELKKKADIVIALTHLGIYESEKKGARMLASEVEGIDVIVDGHTHTRLEEAIIVPKRDLKTIIVQAWQWGLILGRLDLWIKDKKVIDFRFKAIPVNLKTIKENPDGTKLYSFVGKRVKEDSELLKILRPYAEKVNSALSEVIGYSEETFSYRDTRMRETPLGNFIADAILWHTKYMGVDFAIHNGGGIRNDLPAGKITKKIIYDILPFEDRVVVLTLKGRHLVELFRYIATIPRGKGAFPQVSEGLSFTINYSKGKCEDILVKGMPIDPERNYKVATNSYMAQGGDGYNIFLNAIDKVDTSVFMRDVLIEYIKFVGGKIRPEEKGRIKIIDKPLTQGIKADKVVTLYLKQKSL
jgi:5'-nucleotidase/UDP-sugar diphosphatase